MTGRQIKNNWQKDFFTVWAGQAFSLLGSSLVNFSLIWWLTEKTGSAMVLAIATAFALIPRIIAGPFLGALVDRMNRKRVMILADAAIALSTIVIVLLFKLEVVEIWHLYILLALRSIGETFHFPAMQASTTLMVPDEHLPRISGINQMLDGGLKIVGPPLGALLLGLMPFYGVLSIDIVTALLAIIPLFFVEIPQPKPVLEKQKLQQEKSGLWQEVKESFQYLLGFKGLALIMGVSMMSNFLYTPAFNFLPLYVTEYFNGDVWQLSIFETVIGAGMLIGGLILGVWGGFKRKMYTILFGILFSGAFMFLLGMVPSDRFGTAVMMMAGHAIVNSITNGAAFALLQSVVAPEMQGRIFSTVSSVAMMMSPLGLLIIAPVIERFGLPFWFLCIGVMSVLMGFASFATPEVIGLEKEMNDSKGVLGTRLC
ncbi:MAG: MFS transporter [Anaerolineaceae bacterium]|nr:MFS transporter [Anaerolineaceae bacterium]